VYWDFAGPTVIADTSSLTTRRPWYSMVYNDAVQGLALSPYGMTDASRYQVQHLAGQKQYELTNHLGNVQATISDLPVKVGEAHTEYHAPALPAVYDYYPFGMLMPDRYTSDTSSECVTVSQTKWVTTWVTHCYLAADWVWPAYSYYGTVSVSTSSGLQIAASESSGVYFEMDVLPYEQQDVYLQTDAFYSGSGTLELQEYHGGQWHMLGSTTFDKLGEVRISIRPREDRIRAVLRGPFYVQVKQFCVQRPQLSQETVLVDICDTDGDKYSFGFNGQEKINEWAGIGNFIDYKERGQDTRIARFLSVDNLAASYPWYTPYQFAGNDPIRFIDRDGLEPAPPEKGKKNLLVVVQGHLANPEKGMTQTKNAQKLKPRLASDANGLGSLQKLSSKHPDLQVVVFASGSYTEGDVEKTITDFRKANSTGKIIGVGHSLGANELVSISGRAKPGLIDLLISIDIQGTSLFNTKDEVGPGAWGAIGYHTKGSLFSIGGNVLKFKSAMGINKEVPGTWHTSIDNVLSMYDEKGNFNPDQSILVQDIENELNFTDKEPVTEAENRTLPDMSQQSTQIESTQ
jgi:RHS repeat-associated protein